uniref:ribose-phosphate diphosphokinase n=1 Tax=Alexandrium catenella TaxID=2925 RepID=A0A7S1PRE2_ALECA
MGRAMDTDSSEEFDAPEAPAVRIPLGHRPVVFTLPGSRALAEGAMRHLGWPLGKCSFSNFSNGEIQAKVDEPVTNSDVFVFCARDDLVAEPNFTMMQLLLFIAALRGESPHRLTVILPCLEYARQDRRIFAGEAITARLFLRCMKAAGADRFLTGKLHNEAQVAFAPDSTVLDDLSCTRYLGDFVRANVEGFDPDKTLVCATNGGGSKETKHMADELRTGFMMADHMRPKEGGVGEVKIICGKADHVEAIVIVDDIVDTCGRLSEVTREVHKLIPTAKIYAVMTHGYFSGDAHLRVKEMVDNCGLQWIAVTNSIAQTQALQRLGSLGCERRLRVVDISRQFAGAVLRIHLGSSVNTAGFASLGPDDPDPLLQSLLGCSLPFERQQSPQRQAPPPKRSISGS